jgi:hypothetical protein
MSSHTEEPAGIFIGHGEQTVAGLSRWSPEAPPVRALLTSALEDEEIRVRRLVELMVEPLDQARDRR